jgi:hypothetical protein
VHNSLRSSTGRFICFSSIHSNIDNWTTYYPKLLKEYMLRNTLQLGEDGNQVEGIISVVHGLVVHNSTMLCKPY